ncbi:MAG: UDP-3-O-(3-hydroxymyristoyl)glucosamine N-acyltransferase [Saprospiraceae bacterium]|nr:UDP-3-O-(3-hydroxymyristoyl)glucosamine N-acyltransferase [Saprospiraceae bacterium]
MEISAGQLAELLNGTLEGNPEVLVSQPSKIEEGGPGTVSFLGNMKYESHLYKTTASVVIIPQDLSLKESTDATLIRVDDVYSSLGFLLNQFQDSSAPTPGQDSLSFVHTDATVDPLASIGAFSIISPGASIAADAIIFPQVFIGPGVSVGKNTIIHPGAKIYRGCQIGNYCVIHSNAVIGSDGFGFSPTENGDYKKIPQVGNVVVEDNVEIGANTVIDRASIGHTYIRKGAKLDNLIQIAHNVDVGKNTVIAAQAGIAGSTRLGENCQIGGQAGFVGHIEVADGTKVQAQSGISHSLEKEGAAWYGSPALSYRDYLKSYAIFKNLPGLQARIRDLEKQIKALEGE